MENWREEFNQFLKTQPLPINVRPGGYTADALKLAYQAGRNHPIEVSLEEAARALWNLEHEGRNSQILDIEWSLLSTDYMEGAKAVLSIVPNVVVKE